MCFEKACLFHCQYHYHYHNLSLFVCLFVFTHTTTVTAVSTVSGLCLFNCNAPPPPTHTHTPTPTHTLTNIGWYNFIWSESVIFMLWNCMLYLLTRVLPQYWVCTVTYYIQCCCCCCVSQRVIWHIQGARLYWRMGPVFTVAGSDDRVWGTNSRFLHVRLWTWIYYEI